MNSNHELEKFLFTGGMSDGADKAAAVGHADHTLEWVALIFTVLACLITQYSIYGHLTNFTMPSQQLYICRILMLAAIYATLSLFSLWAPSWGVFLGFIRDSYEAFVIYSFFQLLMTYLGGAKAVGDWLEVRGHVAHTWLIQELCPKNRNMALGHGFLLWVRRGILQFVVVKPLMSIIALIFSSRGLYTEGSFSFTNSYVYISIVNNMSVSLSLYCLVLFYIAASPILKPFGPLGKFLVVKAVVFASYWQYCGLYVLYYLNIFQSSAEVLRLQDSLICIEMLFASIAHHFAFPSSDYVLDETQRSPMMRLTITNEVPSRPPRDYADTSDDEDDTDATSQLLPKIIKVLDGRDVLKQGKEVFLQKQLSDAELADKPIGAAPVQQNVQEQDQVEL